jgi:cytochrome c oxidase assembly protein subunit 15
MERTHRRRFSCKSGEGESRGRKKVKAYSRFNLINLGYTLLVIMWGAYVRATGSGAGCGEHWPLCNGVVLPQEQSIKTMIEFAHRTSSGLSLILVVVGFFWALKISKKGALIRKAAFLTVIAIFLEAALGAGLVLLRLVELDQSALRAISISLHLVNTLFLLATLVTLSWLSFKPFSFEPALPSARKIFPRDRFFLIALAVFVILGVSGAVTALGDTLFPAESIAHGFQQDLAHDSHFLVRLRGLHPVFALVWIMLAFLWSRKLEIPELLGIRGYLLVAIVTQFLLGFLNWMLMAPNWLQLVHLLVADLVFITFWLSGLKYEARESRITA